MGFENVQFESGVGRGAVSPRVCISSGGQLSFNKLFKEKYNIREGKNAHFQYDNDSEKLRVMFLDTSSRYSKPVKYEKNGGFRMGLGPMWRILKVKVPEKGSRTLECYTDPSNNPGNGLIFGCKKAWHPQRDFEVDSFDESELKEGKGNVIIHGKESEKQTFKTALPTRSEIVKEVKAYMKTKKIKWERQNCHAFGKLRRSITDKFGEPYFKVYYLHMIATGGFKNTLYLDEDE